MSGVSIDLALATTTIAWILMAVVVVGWIIYAAMNAGAARKEVGSEIELAANRKPYYDDEILEGRRLERVQLYGVLLLVVLVIGLPLYWVLEPDSAGRRPGGHRRAASSRGARSCSRPPPTVASTAPGATAG